MKKAVVKFLNFCRAKKQIILYIFFGGCTTAVNIVVYQAMYKGLDIPNSVSVAAAWVLSVLFAFVTNKLFVFESRGRKAGVLIKEALLFFGYRIATGVLDMAIMILAVDVMGWNSLLWKLLSNIVVIIINYLASKYSVFKKI